VSDTALLLDLGYMLAAATVLLVVSRRLHLPSLLAYIVAGVVLGPVLGLLAGSESLELFAELGVALLLFVVGMELGFDKIRAVGPVAVGAGLVQVGLTGLLGAGVGLLFGLETSQAWILGAAVAISSTVVVVKLLERAGSLDQREGRLSIGILLIQDIVVAILLTLLGAMGTGGDGGEVDVLAGVLSAFRGVGVLVAVGWLGARFLLPRLLAFMGRSPEGLLVVALAWAFAFILGAESLHVSIELGALVAGVSMAQCPQNHELRRRVHPLVDLFLALFFVGLGAGMDPSALTRNAALLAVLVVFVVVVKPLLIAVILSALGQPRRESLLAGITLGQVSEFSLILATVAVGAGLLDQELLSVLGLLALASIAASSLLMPAAPGLLDSLESRPVTGRLLRLLPARTLVSVPPPVRAGHVIVVGMNALGRDLVEGFVEQGHRVLAVDTDRHKLQGLPCEVLHGSTDDPEILHEANLDRARLAVSALQIEDSNLLLTYRCVALGVPVSVHAFDPSLVHEFLEMGADHVMVPKLDGVQEMEASLFARGLIG
jgi:Kef-type K+ transport system membrane component KefB